MIDDVSLLAGVCIGLALWVLYLQHKLIHLREFAYMSMKAMIDVADGKVVVSRDDKGTITFKRKEKK